MTFGFAPTATASTSRPPIPADASGRPGRTLAPAQWAAAAIPPLRVPQEVVEALHALHRPTSSTAVVGVLDHDERVCASASFARGPASGDGWVHRNALLTQLRRVTPHDLRRRSPARTAVLLHCRDGETRWTEEDGAWMWGLRDACTLHGLRCGSYITLTASGWQILGEDRGGHRPGVGPAAGRAEQGGGERPAARGTVRAD
ncbi:MULTISPECIES: hypothetical protein [Streptomyces]|uniref:hypothetical protein n=1 Tax=Streptomyces TaxID=1883 RepID=UPI0013BA480D|nr:hypothetical protein [Streptomyces sp. BRB081]MBL3804014.1 hypothetical protein [Streptomyces sp. BRB081]NEE51780.1 hypothetical protein [Streptomyces sp. SID8455]